MRFTSVVNLVLGFATAAHAFPVIPSGTGSTLQTRASSGQFARITFLPPHGPPRLFLDAEIQFSRKSAYGNEPGDMPEEIFHRVEKAMSSVHPDFKFVNTFREDESGHQVHQYGNIDVGLQIGTFRRQLTITREGEVAHVRNM